MGGSVNVLVRFSNNEKKAFRIHTSQLKDFCNPLFFDEKNFKSTIMQNYYKGEPIDKNEHDIYRGPKTYFTPYAYGALFFDFKNKKVFSCNDFDCFLSFYPSTLFAKLTQLICISKESNIHLYDLEEVIHGYNEERTEFKILERHKIFHEPSRFNPEFYALNYALNNDWDIEIYGNKIEHTKDLIKFVNDITGLDILKDTKESLDGYRWSIKESLCASPNYQDYYIDISPKDWTIIQDDGSHDSIKELFEYMTEENILDEKEVSLWEAALAEMKGNIVS